MAEYVVGRVVIDEAAPLPRGTAERSVDRNRSSDDNKERNSMSRSCARRRLRMPGEKGSAEVELKMVRSWLEICSVGSATLRNLLAPRPLFHPLSTYPDYLNFID